MAKDAAMQSSRANPFSRLQEFIQEVKLEMAKVTWPTKEDLKSSTSVVLMLLFFLAIIIGFFDKVCELGIMLLLRLFA